MATAMSCWPWPARRPPMWATCSNKARVRGCSFGPRCQSSFLRTTGRNSCGRFHRTRNEFYRNERIEEIAEQRLQEFEGKLGRPLSIPVDIELFGDLVLGLWMLWNSRPGGDASPKAMRWVTGISLSISRNSTIPDCSLMQVATGLAC